MFMFNKRKNESPSTPSTMYTDRLIDAINAKNNPAVLGLDTRIEFLPIKLRDLCNDGDSIDGAIYEYNCSLIDELAPIIPAVKIQSAYYEMYGHFGIRCMYKSAAYAMQRGLIVMIDAKRNDIGSTAEAYAAAYLGEHGFDGMTVNPYLGYDGIKPFVEFCEKFDKGIYVLCRTSNPSGSELQNLTISDGRPLYAHVGALIDEWGKSTIGKYGYSAVGAVVGATCPQEAETLRRLMPNTFFLVPGYGAQGGNGDTCSICFDENGSGAIVNNSRGIIAAHLTPQYNGMTYFAAAKQAALAMREDLAISLAKAGKQAKPKKSKR